MVGRVFLSIKYGLMSIFVYYIYVFYLYICISHTASESKATTNQKKKPIVFWTFNIPTLLNFQKYIESCPSTFYFVLNGLILSAVEFRYVSFTLAKLMELFFFIVSLYSIWILKLLQCNLMFSFLLVIFYKFLVSNFPSIWLYSMFNVIYMCFFFCNWAIDKT